MGKNFVHTHVHTANSMLDGKANVDDLLKAVAEQGQPAVAITDHGNMFGAYNLYKTAKKYGVKPIIGSELYLAPGDTSRRTRERVKWGQGGSDDVSGGGAFTHMTVLAETTEGMHNLFRISSETFKTGMYYKPRGDRELLAQYAKGLIATTGCPSGEVQTRLRLGQPKEALEAAATYRDIFGKDNYFVEIMDHGLDIEKRTREGLLHIAKQLNLPLLATNDLHYVAKSDAKAHEAMLCVQSGSQLSDPNRFKFDAEEFYLKTSDEMRGIIPDDVFPGACDNTLLIAERCNITFNEGADLMPRFPVPEGETIDTWFDKEVRAGLNRRYPSGVPEDREKLVIHETEVIKKMGFPGYFLVVADYIMWSKKQGIRVGPGRGCLHGDSLITTKTGAKPIRDVACTDFVMDSSGSWVNPTQVHKYECDEKLYRITTEGHDILSLTADHEILVLPLGSEDATLRWVRADALSVGDKVCTPDKAPFGDYLYRRIIQVEDSGVSDGWVYDLTVPTTTSYVAENMVVHNSAAGSLVAYALGITEIDPIEHGLIFERFLNPERVSMPDIDVDFDDARREEVIKYVTDKYGDDKVAQIVTFGLVKAKAAVKDAARILGEPYAVGEKITKLVPPPIVGKDMSLKSVFNPDDPRYGEAADMRKLYKDDPVAKKVIDTALGLEGVTRQWGVHAAGVILSAETLTDHIPVLKRESDGAIITQFDQKTCETLGLLKMDFLGLRNLGIMDEAVKLIQATTGDEIVLEDIPYDDEKTFTLLARGETLGVFQLDSPPMRALLKSMRPDHFEDISAVLALYRPGPMAMNAHNEYADRKNKRKPVKPIHPEIEEPLNEILGDTYGLCLWGEQKIVTDKGVLPIKNVNPGDYVVTHKGTSKITKKILTGQKDVVKIVFSNGRSVVCTPDHEFLTDEGWKPLIVGDYVQVSNHTLTPPYGKKPGNGHVAGKSSSRARQETSRKKGKKGKKGVTGFDGDVFEVTSVANITDTLDEVTIKVSQLPSSKKEEKRFLRNMKNFFDKIVSGPQLEPKHISIPHTIFALKEKERVQHIQQIIEEQHEKHADYVTLWTRSAENAEHFSDLLYSLGIYNMVKFNGLEYLIQVPFFERYANFFHSEATPVKKVSIRRNKLRFTYRLGDKYLFGKKKGKKNKNKNKKKSNDQENVTVKPRISQKNHPGKDLFVEVVSIHPYAYEVPVYDIEVEKDHSFMVAGVIAHNCIYQEQVQRIAQNLAGYTAGQADELRRAMGKKNKEIIDNEFVPFKQGMMAKGYSEKSVDTLWEVLVPFADYAFNKAHTAAYGTISYWTAWLKANYPTQYMAALLTSVSSDKDKTALYMNECRRMGITVMAPDINTSGAHYTPVPESNAIRVGLSAIRNVGTNVVHNIISTREQQGEYTGFGDFLRKVPASVCNKRTVDSLIKAGAFSHLHSNRAQLSAMHAEAIDAHLVAKKKTVAGQADMFATFAEETGGSHTDLFTVPDVEEWDRITLLGFERDMLGRYITDHPVRGYQKSLENHSDAPIVMLFPPEGKPPKARATVAGIVTHVGAKKTKKGDPYAVVTVEDTTGAVDVTVLPRAYEPVQHLLQNDSVVSIQVNVDFREDGSWMVLGNTTTPIELSPDPEDYDVEKIVNPIPTITLHVEEKNLTPQFISLIKQILEDDHLAGKSPVKLQLRREDFTVVHYSLPNLVKPDRALWRLKGLLGENNVTVE